MTPDFADREATSIINLCRSLQNAPGDLHGLIAAKLRVIQYEGKADGIAYATATLDRVFGKPDSPSTG